MDTSLSQTAGAMTENSAGILYTKVVIFSFLLFVLLIFIIMCKHQLFTPFTMYSACIVFTFVRNALVCELWP